MKACGSWWWTIMHWTLNISSSFFCFVHETQVKLKFRLLLFYNLHTAHYIRNGEHEPAPKALLLRVHAFVLFFNLPLIVFVLVRIQCAVNGILMDSFTIGTLPWPLIFVCIFFWQLILEHEILYFSPMWI